MIYWYSVCRVAARIQTQVASGHFVSLPYPASRRTYALKWVLLFGLLHAFSALRAVNSGVLACSSNDY